MPIPDPLDDSTSRIEAARSVRSTADARRLYAEWADDYDVDVFDRMKVTGSGRVADLLADHLSDRSTPVVDIGCGTGAVGKRLASSGFTNLTGIDLSPEMLSIARQCGAYRSLLAADLRYPPTRARRFGGSVSAGTFVAGHLGGAAVAGLVEMLGPNAVIAWSVTPDLWPEIEQALQAEAVTIRRSSLEQIRADSDDRAHLVIGIAPG